MIPTLKNQTSYCTLNANWARASHEPNFCARQWTFLNYVKFAAKLSWDNLSRGKCMIGLNSLSKCGFAACVFLRAPRLVLYKSKKNNPRTLHGAGIMERQMRDQPRAPFWIYVFFPWEPFTSCLGGDDMRPMGWFPSIGGLERNTSLSFSVWGKQAIENSVILAID